MIALGSFCFFPQSGFSRLGDRAFTYCEEEEEEEGAWECVGVGDSGDDCGGDALSDCLFLSWLLHWNGAEFRRLCRNLLCPELFRKQFGNVCAGGVRIERVLT